MSDKIKTYLRKQQVNQIKAVYSTENTSIKNDTFRKLSEETRSELLKNTEAERKKRSKNYSVNNSTEFEVQKGNLVITTYVGDYEQKIELTSFLDRLRNRVLSSQYYKITVDNIRTLLRNCFSDMDLRVSCTCGDWKYRIAYRASENGYIYGEKETRAANITNPNDTKGSLCKHLIRVLSNYSWLSFLSGVVYRYLKNHVKELARAFDIPNLEEYFARDYNKKDNTTPLREPSGTEDDNEDSSNDKEKPKTNENTASSKIVREKSDSDDDKEKTKSDTESDSDSKDKNSLTKSKSSGIKTSKSDDNDKMIM